MNAFVALFFVLIAVAYAAPQGSSSNVTPVPIISENSNIQPDGSFQYAFEAGNGIKEEAQGSLKNVQVPKPDGSGTEQVQALVQTGSFSYPSPDGTQIELKYTADENGFHPEGTHLPVAPAASF
ncbi:endocuticle structural glycoprotein SgAbd-8-like [Topomyia yanbarensis]|uniref:endocuticle structural glycoprotein SgAbd-8-like n=1 Tax=Topomyia yanbarensis TaxID=2498891 RepID=UPI00273B1AF4|nr:endocuticle structural glycoprotein SgAbd-8-like [Topomyia yanbarensis]